MVGEIETFPYQRILITGASSGIGRYVAQELARPGVRIYLIARRRKALEETAAMVSARGGEGLVCPCDLRNLGQTAEVFSRIEAETGPLDLVIANAGANFFLKYPSDDNPDKALMIVDLNFRAAIYTLEFFARGMLRQGRGHLVGISSIAGYRGLAGAVVYSATKAGFRTYLEALRFRVSYKGIKVTDIRPGYIRTPMTAENRYPMPFLMDVEPAARKIVTAILKGKKRYTFPWPMALFGKILYHLPDTVYDYLGSKALGPRRKSTPAPKATEKAG